MNESIIKNKRIHNDAGPVDVRNTKVSRKPAKCAMCGRFTDELESDPRVGLCICEWCQELLDEDNSGGRRKRIKNNYFLDN